ncbi:cystathionine gamma-synthase [Corynebacterium genitalium ATCC 33030]|uniref:Cystathionine gamma-synthase n=1 Tax=Corynebacterium genitalium ATCC 33030 TaxID=585529 RepID=D7WC25_9CORY|nr:MULTISPECIES: cystathionine gamma-synthase [Corynebacterium]MCQ4618478.1 cystathionine gamma-synthase [Corynebacterium pseudogenitalium]EFK54654.1 Cys/Met metabolism PLP-dependent enzyme [Corynebacterium genitalium ATCC 33030]MCQ4621362.1 cystathionine gamma-synthase [Corynebacterium sp. CCUG 71335]MCQ4623249.1 cystathionine gamma-synthase [Corynebacterium sp. CCUG 70398]MCQ4625643.1 cystathionine gamma-synthase [Corynebacterium sp. CCUG 69979]
MPGFSTDSIHAGYEPDSLYGSINTPIYASTTFAQDDLAVTRNGFEYTRVGNPTIDALEKTVAALEKADYGVAFGSGMAAVDALLRILLKPGDHIVIGNDAYGGTYRLIQQIFTQWGVENTPVDITNVDEVAAAIQPNTKVVWVESPTNPLLSIADIEGLSAVKGDATLVVDNTFASPYLQQPLDLGADVVLHSTTKYIGGHSDVVGGVVVGRNAVEGHEGVSAITAGSFDALNNLEEQLRFFFGWIGAIPSPFDTYLTARGAKTLAVRMDKHCDNAEAVADYLSKQDKVARVYYPGLEDHPGHDIAVKQMRRFGGMVSVAFQTAEQAMTFCRSTKLFCLAESLGGVESLVEHPATMTHVSVAGSALEVPPELVRISVGIEDTEDLIADLEQAIAQI